MLLDKIADVSTGLVITRRQANVNSAIKAQYKLLTLKSFNDNGWIEKEELEEFDSNEVLDDRYLTLSGDVIIRLTAPYTAIPIDDEFSGLVVPSQFCIIRPVLLDLSPDYLAYALNSETIKNEYIRTSLGATIPMIRMGALKGTKIPIFDLDKQFIIGNIRRLIIKNKQLGIELEKNIDILNKQIELRILGGNK